MKLKKCISLLLCTVMLVSAFPFVVYAKDAAPDDDYVKDEIIISCDEDLTDSGIDLDAAGIDSIEKLQTYSEENVYVAEISGNVEKTCEELNNKYDGIVAEPNCILHNCGFQMPAEASDSNALYAQYQKQYLNNILHVTDAWQHSEVSGEGVTIAIIDSGFYIDATDFSQNLWKNSLGTVGWNVHENNDDIGPIYKSGGQMFTENGMWATQHGTNIAGAIGMASNGIGGIGAAYGAELMLIKAAEYVDDSLISISLSDTIEAIDFARENGADVINFSLSTTSNYYSMLMAVNRAYSDGVAFVASVANAGKAVSTEKSYPAAYSHVIGVMALDTANPSQLTKFSNYDDSATQEYYDIAAPGTSIVGCDVISGSLTMFSGASQACAFVTSCAALYLEKYPLATVDDLYSAIRTFNTDTVKSYPRSGESTFYYKSMNADKLLGYCSHNVCSETVITEPNCTEEGTMQCVCSVCGYTYTKAIPIRHTWGEWQLIDYPSYEADGSFIHYCQNCPEHETRVVPIRFKNCDVDRNIITGIDPGMPVWNFKNNRTIQENIFWISVFPIIDLVGTGTRVVVYYSDDGPAAEYSVILYGDVDGDGWYDGTDSIIVNCLANGLLSKEQVGEAAYAAADCNHDGAIDSADVSILEQAGIILAGVDQSKTAEELAEDSAYQEYLSLIDQNPTEETADEPVDEGFNKSFIQRIIDFIIHLFTMIMSFIPEF